MKNSLFIFILAASVFVFSNGSKKEKQYIFNISSKENKWKPFIYQTLFELYFKDHLSSLH